MGFAVLHTVGRLTSFLYTSVLERDVVSLPFLPFLNRIGLFLGREEDLHPVPVDDAPPPILDLAGGEEGASLCWVVIERVVDFAPDALIALLPVSALGP